METNPAKNIEECFSTLTDPRVNRRKRHPLMDILIIAICAVICEADTWEDMAEFGRAKYKWFQNFLELPNGIPSPDTFNRVFAALNPVEFEYCFLLWADGLRQALGDSLIHLDGKTLRRSHDSALGKTALKLVSAWASGHHLVLGQVKVADDSNEITAIPELLKVLALKGCIVTIDAMGTQKDIVAKIRGQEADYVLALKDNQGLLYEGVVESFQEGLATNFQDIAHDYYETVEKGHGRIETRKYWTIFDPDYLKYFDPQGEWQDLKSVGMVEAERIIQGKVSRERRYYISSLSGKAKPLGRAIRSHWSIENSLHWVLDVDFGEDQSRKRKGHAAENFGMLCRLAINLIKHEQTARRSVKGRRLKACWDEDYLVRVLTSMPLPG
jgi:predicted transposase YbfD/YdcC